MPKRERTSEELISELQIANHNLTSCMRNIQECEDDEDKTELWNLYKMFEEHYDEVKKELYRRLEFYERCKKQ